MSESEVLIEAAEARSDSECIEKSEEMKMSGVLIEMGEPKEGQDE